MIRIIVIFFWFSSLQAQIHEVGFFLGGSNYIGDVGSTVYINPNEPAIGLLYKMNLSPRHSWRFSYMQTNLSASDLDSKSEGRKNRGYHFKNNIKEVSAGLEFNFFDFNLHETERKITPYVHSGLSYTRLEELYVEAGETKKDKNSGTIAIPMTIGVKSNVLPNLILALEVGARYTFTDNLDGSNPKNKNLESFQFGNINNNDWYVFSGFTITYTFGRKPCYCRE